MFRLRLTVEDTIQNRGVWDIWIEVYNDGVYIFTRMG